MRKLIADPRASASGHKQALKRLHLMSALPPKADIAYGDARFESWKVSGVITSVPPFARDALGDRAAIT